jgi:hypothetical protein
MVLLSLSGLALASDKCEAMLKQRSYLKAAQCFQQRSDKMPPPDQLSKIQRYLKGQALRSAWTAYDKAAVQTKDIEKGGHYRENALKLIDFYLKNKLCPKPYLCQIVLGKQTKIRKAIGYAQLTVVTDSKVSGFLEVKGYKYLAKKTTPPQWSQAVRPGRYTVTVTYEGQKALVRRLIVRPNTPRVLTMFPKKAQPDKRIVVRVPPPRRIPPKTTSTNVVPLVLIGVGAAVTVAGGVLLGMAVLQDGERNTIATSLVNDAKELSPSERAKLAGDEKTKNGLGKIDSLATSASTLELAGYGAAGGGIAILAAGIVLALLPKKPAKKTKAALLPFSSKRRAKLLSPVR